MYERYFSTGRRSHTKTVSRLILGDILSVQAFRSDPVHINQEYGCRRAKCSKATFTKALKELQEGVDGRPFIVQTSNHRAGHKAKGYNIPSEVLSEGIEWKELPIDKPAITELPGHLQTEDTEAQRIHFRNIRADWYFPSLAFLERMKTEREGTPGRIVSINFEEFNKVRSAQQLAEALTDFSRPPIVTTNLEDPGAFLLEIAYRFHQLHQLATGGTDYFIFQLDLTQRIYSTVTQIYREARGGFRYHYTGGNYTRLLRPSEIAPYNGLPFTEIDVANCQPLILAALLNGEGVPCKKLLQDTQDGSFHRTMMNALGITDKGTQKKQLFHYLYGRPNDRSRDPYREAFTDVYGHESSQFIEQHKWENGYKALPIQMQRMESSAMIFRASRRVRHLHPSAPVLSVHDSLLIPFREELIQDTRKAIKHAFYDLYGVEATVNEDSKTDQNEG